MKTKEKLDVEKIVKESKANQKKIKEGLENMSPEELSVKEKMALNKQLDDLEAFAKQIKNSF